MSTVQHFDVVLIGSGSGNSFPGPEFADKSIAYIDRGVGPLEIFGGTCLNVGCIPTKMFVHTADIAANARGEHSARFGVSTREDGVDFAAVRERIFGRIDPISRGGLEYRTSHEDNANLTYFNGTASFVGTKRVRVHTADGDVEITGDTFLLATGSRPVIPKVPGLEDSEPFTSDTIMRAESLPASIAIMGSGVIALEFAHILEAFGTRVHLIARSGALLRKADRDVSARITEVASSRYTVHLNTSVTEVRVNDDGTRTLSVSTRDGESAARSEITVDQILVAVGRTPNSDVLRATEGGLGVDEAGRVMVDEYQRALDPNGSVLEGVWAIGDLSSPQQLKHVANHELRIARHNILHPEQMRRSDLMPVPAGVFTHPQIAYVGMTEDEARAWGSERGIEISVGRQDFAHIAYGWAMELEAPGDFVKVIVRRDTGAILGAHIIGPQAPTLIQVLIQAMSLGTPASAVAREQYWIHPAMPEVIENALLQVV